MYAAMAHTGTYMHPRFLQGGLSFFRDAVMILWHEFATDADSSADYKRGKFIDDLERETDKMTNAHQEADQKWKQTADLDRHNKELFDMTVVCLMYDLPVRSLRHGMMRQGPAYDHLARTERITSIDMTRTGGNVPCFSITTKQRPARQHLDSIVTLDPFLRVIPGILSTVGTAATTRNKRQVEKYANHDMVSMVSLPIELIRWILWQKSKSNMLQTFLFVKRASNNGKCVLPQHIVKTIVGMHHDYIRRYIKKEIEAKAINHYHYSAITHRQYRWSLKQCSKPHKSIYDFSRFETDEEGRFDANPPVVSHKEEEEEEEDDQEDFD
jgi:hypothetical protein